MPKNHNGTKRAPTMKSRHGTKMAPKTKKATKGKKY